MTKTLEFLTFADAQGGPPLSPAVRSGDYVHISGQVPFDDARQIVGLDVESQTRQVMANLEKALGLAGCTLSDVIKTTVWLADARDFPRFNTVYSGFFTGGFPARSTTEARLMGDFLVEIEAIAYKPL